MKRLSLGAVLFAALIWAPSASAELTPPPPQPVSPANGELLEVTTSGIDFTARYPASTIYGIEVWSNGGNTVDLTASPTDAAGIRTANLPLISLTPGAVDSLYVGTRGSVDWRPYGYCYESTLGTTGTCYGETRELKYVLAEFNEKPSPPHHTACSKAKTVARNLRVRASVAGREWQEAGRPKKRAKLKTWNHLKRTLRRAEGKVRNRC